MIRIRMICDYHMKHPDQRESMTCPDCNRCVDCGRVYYDDEDDPGNDECPYCSNKIIDAYCMECKKITEQSKLLQTENIIKFKCLVCGAIQVIKETNYVRWSKNERSCL